MADPNINEVLKVVAGQFSGIIHRKIINTGPWLKLQNRHPWPDEMGDEISDMVYLRSLPEKRLHWAHLRSHTAATGTSCLPPVATINFKQEARSYGLQQTALESPRFCVSDLRFAHKRASQLNAIQNILTENTKIAWEERNRDEYIRVCYNKLVARNESGALPGFGDEADMPEFATAPDGSDLLGAAFPDFQANSILTQSMLDRIRMRMIREGAGVSPMGFKDGAPEFALICSSETSSALLAKNPEIVQDLRWGKPNELLAPLGVERSYKGYYHLIDDFMPRFTYNATTKQYTMVRAWEQAGGVWELNPLYETAPYELSVVYHKDVCDTLIPAPITNPGGGTKFDPVSYTGDFRFLNIRDEEKNPDGTIGYFRAILASGTRPNRREFGYAIIHLRCSNVEFIDCSGAAVPA